MIDHYTRRAALLAAAKVLQDADYYRGHRAEQIDVETTWQVARAMIATLVDLAPESVELADFIVEGGAVAPVLSALVGGDDELVSRRLRALCRTHCVGYIEEALEYCPTRSEIRRDLEVDLAIDERKRSGI